MYKLIFVRFFSLKKEPMYFVMLGYLIFFSVLVYAIIIYCARQIHTFSKQFAFDDQTSRYINRQILKTLVVQVGGMGRFGRRSRFPTFKIRD